MTCLYDFVINERKFPSVMSNASGDVDYNNGWDRKVRKLHLLGHKRATKNHRKHDMNGRTRHFAVRFQTKDRNVRKLLYVMMKSTSMQGSVIYRKGE